MVKQKRNPDNNVDFYFEKSEPGSFLLSVKFKSVFNSHVADYLGVVKAGSGKFLSLRPIAKNNPISFSYSYSFIRGIPNPKVDSSFIYAFPFAKGKTVLVNELNYFLLFFLFLGLRFFFDPPRVGIPGIPCIPERPGIIP